MNVTLRTPLMTREQFLDWVERQETPFEFNGYEPVPMTGGNKRHMQLCRNLTVALWSRLANSGLQVLPEGGIATVGRSVRYPDVMIATNADADTDRLISEPLVVFEVLSPSSGRTDYSVKLREYRAVPSIRRYIVVDNTGPDLTVYGRAVGGAEWTANSLTTDDMLELPEVGITVPVNEIFAGIVFEEATASV